MTLSLKTIGYGNLSTSDSRVKALQRMKQRQFSLVVFEATGGDMPALDFVLLSLQMDSEVVLIAASAQPQIDDVFGLLSAGSRGYLAIPFTPQHVEEAVNRALEGPPFSESVLQAPDRNSALAGVVLNSLYRLAVTMRQAREFDSAKRRLEQMKYNLHEAVELARLFCEKGDEAALRDKIIEDCLVRSAAAASRLGRTRQRLKRKRRSDKAAEDGGMAEGAFQ